MEEQKEACSPESQPLCEAKVADVSHDTDVQFRTPPLSTSSPRIERSSDPERPGVNRMERQLRTQSTAEPKAFVSYHDVVDELASKLGIEKSPRRSQLRSDEDDDTEDAEEDLESFYKPMPSPAHNHGGLDENLHEKPGVETLVKKQGVPVYGTIPVIEEVDSGRAGKAELSEISPKEETVDVEPKIPIEGIETECASPDSRKSKEGVDEIDVCDRDAGSEFSYYMKKNFQYYFQHPWLRLLVAYLVVLCNFLIFAEDPVSHSYKECAIPVVGHGFSFIVRQYPPNGWAVLKV